MVTFAKFRPVDAKQDSQESRHRQQDDTREMLLVAPSMAAQMMDLTRAQLWQLHMAGKVPSPIYLGKKAPRWRVEELRAWVQANCPDRLTWQMMKAGRTA